MSLSPDAPLRATLDALPELVIALDAGARVVDANRTAQRLLGVGRSELARDPNRFMTVVPPGERAWLQEALRRVRAGESSQGELNLFGPEGPCRLSVQVFPASEVGAASPGLAVLRGQRLAAPVRPHRPAPPPVGLADHGLAMASLLHDLNNALSVLSNSLDAMEPEMPPLLSELTRGAMVTCREVSRDLRRLSEGAGNLQPRPTAVGPLLRQVLDELAEQGQQRPRVLLDERLGEAIALVDAAALSRVLREIVVRARLARATQIEVRARRVDGLLAIELRDDGLGMSEDELQRLSRPAVPDGRGMQPFNLPVLRGVVRAHGGELEVGSRPDVGTSFVLTLPAHAQLRPVAAPALPPLPKHVLIVEDDPGLRQSLTWLMRAQGVAVFTAADGRQALEVLAAVPRVDLVLLDLALPGGSGLDVLRQMRERGMATRVVMMSGYAEEHEARDAHNLGALGFLGKPFRLRELQALLATRA